MGGLGSVNWQGARTVPVIVYDHPYLKPMGTEAKPHHLLYWVRCCREAVIAKNIEDAKGFLERISNSLNHEMAQVSDAFRRFDVDKSGKLDPKEFRYMCAYIGWGYEEAARDTIYNCADMPYA
eukprot:s1107_g4.t1